MNKINHAILQSTATISAQVYTLEFSSQLPCSGRLVFQHSQMKIIHNLLFVHLMGKKSHTNSSLYTLIMLLGKFD